MLSPAKVTLVDHLKQAQALVFIVLEPLLPMQVFLGEFFYLFEIEINGYFSQFLHLGIETFTWTWLHFTAIIISYLLFYIFGIVSGVLHGTGQGEYYAMIYLLAQPTTYLTGKKKLMQHESCLLFFQYF